MDGCGCVLTKHDLWKQTAGQSWPEGRSLPTSNLNTLLCPTEPCNLPPRVYHTRSPDHSFCSGYDNFLSFREPPSSSLPQDLCISYSFSLKKFSRFGFWPRLCFFILSVIMGAPQMLPFVSHVTSWFNGASLESFSHQKRLPLVSLISILWFPSLEGHITDINYLIVYLYFGFGFCLPPHPPP